MHLSVRVSCMPNLLVLCVGLNTSVAHVRSLNVAGHRFPHALLEEHCLGIDVCLQTNVRSESVPANTWLSRNSSRMLLAGERELLQAGGLPGSAYNHHSLEFARIPQGVSLEACQPDLSDPASTTCTPGTLVHRSGRCPSAQGFTLLDCLAPVQYDASALVIPFRQEFEHMAFGNETWDAACAQAGAGLSPEGAAFCALLRNSLQVHLPQAAVAGTTQLVRYSMQEGFGCFSTAPIGSYLSSLATPNQVLACPPVANGRHVASDSVLTCSVECDALYELMPGDADGPCVHRCRNATYSACPASAYIKSTCVMPDGSVLYDCGACSARPGMRVGAWTPASSTCVYEPCPVGFFNAARAPDEVQCSACAVDTVSAASGAVACVSCNTSSTGLYQPAGGQSACVPCFADPGRLAAGECRPGELKTGNESLIRRYFQDAIAEHLDMTALCHAGFACLPCVPGTYELAGECVECDTGTYQPNYMSTQCFACADGQNTTRRGAASETACVCIPGHE